MSTLGTILGTGRYGDWIQTYTGVKFYPLDPRAAEVRIEDIARALSLTCRFGGHIRRFYSVAEHCINVHDIAVRLGHPAYNGIPLCALLHDAAEAYVGDMVRPIKRDAKMEGYRTAEDRVLDAVLDSFGLRRHYYGYETTIKHLDNVALAVEAEMLCGVRPIDGWHEKEGMKGLVTEKSRLLLDDFSFFREDKGPPDRVEGQFLSIFASNMRLMQGNRFS